MRARAPIAPLGFACWLVACALQFAAGCSSSDHDDGEASGGANAGGGTSASGATSVTPESCSDDSQCDRAKGFACIDQVCRVACDSHFDCARAGLCESARGATYCSFTGAATPGEYYTLCPQGQSDCADGFTCLGSGPGDLDAYCTGECANDDDCPSGFQCGTINAAPCDEQCGVSGSTSANCIASSRIGVGRSYSCVEPFGLVHHVCKRRGFCSPCERDEDCLGVPGQICAKDKSGAKICTVPCQPADSACPWGNAAECGLFDPDRGYTCAHRFGSCQGSGPCEPCVDSIGCAPTGFCSRTTFTNEQYCVDLSVSCDCGADADANGVCTGHGCPKSPGGLPMTCFSISRYTGDPLSHHCVGATSISSLGQEQQAGCWQ